MSDDNFDLANNPQDYRTLARQQRRQRRAERRALREEGGLGWMAGLVLIAIGVIYLLYDYDVLPHFTNWWALFILLPAAGSFSAGLAAYRRSGDRWTREAVGLFLAAALFASLTAVFLFSLNLSIFGPLLLIGGGLLLLFGPR